MFDIKLYVMQKIFYPTHCVVHTVSTRYTLLGYDERYDEAIQNSYNAF